MEQMLSVTEQKLKSIVRSVIQEEFEKINTVSLEEQKELEALHKNALYENDYDENDVIRL